MAAPGFEWFVAWRHLRDPERQTHKTLVFGLTVLALGGLCLAATFLLPKLGWFGIRKVSPADWPEARPLIILGQVKTAGIVALIVGGMLTLLGALFATFTVFAAVSIYGVFLGTGAPIIALSVMSGFETDLKTKIRATKADVVVERRQEKEARPFTDWVAVEKKLDGVPGVVGAMPYIEAEVIIKHATNPAGMGIILRGIDPERAPKVLGLDRTLQEGKVEYLAHPEEIPTDEAQMMRPIPAPDDQADGADESDGDDAKAPEGGAAKKKLRARVFRDLPQLKRDSGPPPPGILLGEELYQHTLRVFIGSDVDVACPLCGVGPTGPMPKLRPFRVAGHFYIGMYEFDSKLAYVSLAEAQRFLNMQGEVSGIEVRTRTPEDARAVADAIAARVGPDYEVRTWEELNRGLFAALKLEKLAMFIVLTFIALVASFSIISNLIMLVTEKGREVAILKSMGARDGAILRVFFAEGLYIGMLGLALGLALGIGGCVLLMRYGLPLDPDVYYIQKLPVVMRATEIVAVSVAALALCCLATVYPALLGSRMRPVEGLRYE
jgi:lipoprotein-releasing system permease protein